MHLELGCTYLEPPSILQEPEEVSILISGLLEVPYTGDRLIPSVAGGQAGVRWPVTGGGWGGRWPVPVAGGQRPVSGGWCPVEHGVAGGRWLHLMTKASMPKP